MVAFLAGTIVVVVALPRIVWATGGVAVGSPDMPPRGWFPSPDLGIRPPHNSLVASVARASCRAKAPCLGADGGDTRWCRALLEDVVVDLLSVSRLQVKTSVRLDSAAATLCVVFPLDGVVVELRCARVLRACV